MFLIDFETKGNVIRLYFGSSKDYFGDDWDDTPYEHNASMVYSHFVETKLDIAFPFRCNVLTPENDYHYNGNSPYCKNDFKENKAPCMIITTKNDYNTSYSERYSGVGDLFIYFNTEYNKLREQIRQFGGTFMGETINL